MPHKLETLARYAGVVVRSFSSVPWSRIIPRPSSQLPAPRSTSPLQPHLVTTVISPLAFQLRLQASLLQSLHEIFCRQLARLVGVMPSKACLDWQWLTCAPKSIVMCGFVLQSTMVARLRITTNVNTMGAIWRSTGKSIQLKSPAAPYVLQLSQVAALCIAKSPEIKHLGRPLEKRLATSISAG